MAGRHHVAALTTICAAAALLSPAPAAAARTIGADLSLPASPAPGPADGDTTFKNQSGVGGTVTAPTDGVLVRWRTRQFNGPVALRVLAPVAAPSTYRGAGTSAIGIATGAAPDVFPTRLPISAGQEIAFNVAMGAQFASRNTGGAHCQWNPPLADGDTRNGNCNSAGGLTFLYNADIEPDADRDGYGDETQDRCPIEADNQKACNNFTLGRVKRNKNKGTATIAAKLPAAGKLVVSGRGLKKTTKTVAAPGTVKGKVKPKGAVDEKLEDDGAAKVKPKLTFLPTGGDPASATKKVKLVEKD